MIHKCHDDRLVQNTGPSTPLGNRSTLRLVGARVNKMLRIFYTYGQRSHNQRTLRHVIISGYQLHSRSNIETKQQLLHLNKLLPIHSSFRQPWGTRDIVTLIINFGAAGNSFSVVPNEFFHAAGWECSNYKFRATTHTIYS
jgi:hypothetical protein